MSNVKRRSSPAKREQSAKANLTTSQGGKTGVKTAKNHNVGRQRSAGFHEPDMPLHPLFDNLLINQQLKHADYLDCLDALDRIRQLVALNNCVNKGLSVSEEPPCDVVAGQYWLSLMIEDSLRYIGQRLRDMREGSVESDEPKASDGPNESIEEPMRRYEISRARQSMTYH